MYDEAVLANAISAFQAYAVATGYARSPIANSFNQSMICLSTNTLSLKKVPTFKLSVTLSNLKQFSKFLRCWKVYEICYSTHTYTKDCTSIPGSRETP